jgi:2,3-bisphosphoglycerate-independent phosphoglycerate mutase
MDRDKRWDRVERAYRALAAAEGERAASARQAVDAAYGRGESDEFVAPTAIDGYAGMADGDGLVMGNFRADRVRQILTALLDPDFAGFERPRTVRFAAALGMTEYATALNAFLAALFPPERLDQLLGQVLAGRGLAQLRIAETEKYAHVTFFFNGGIEEPFKGEDRILIPSPRVATYDLKPEMSAREVTDALVAAIESGKYDFILVNYANGDMVGHTGNFDAAVKAVEAVDECLGRLESAVSKASGVLLITADHGNAELMRDYERNQPHTAHTVNTVPLVLVNAPPWVRRVRDGKLADIAPTVLELMGLEKPDGMTGASLLDVAGDGRERVRAKASA